MNPINLRSPGTWEIVEDEEGSSVDGTTNSPSSSAADNNNNASNSKSETSSQTPGVGNKRKNPGLNDSDSKKPWRLSFETLEKKIQSDETINSHQKQQVKEFYKHQNELVDTLREINKLHKSSKKSKRRSKSSESDAPVSSDIVEDEEPGTPQESSLTQSSLRITFPLTLLPFSVAFHVQLCVYGTFAINIFLLIIKMFAAISTGSLTVIASALDSFLDLFAGAVLFLTQYLSSRYQSETWTFPGGTSRIEPIGIIIFASTMSVATLQLILASVQRLLGSPEDAVINLDTLSIAIICFTVFAKGSLYIYCSMIQGSESVLALKKDHRNDVVTNSFGLVVSIIAYYKYWWFDPVGAILIGLWILSVWVRTGSEQVRMLSGYKADDDFLKQITYLTWNHDERIKAIDTVRAFHMAYKVMVEVDIVLDENMPLKEAHDIGESLQDKIEELELVERAWVHLDYETSHQPEHKWQKEVRGNILAKSTGVSGVDDSEEEEDEQLRKRRKREKTIEEP